MKHVLSSILIRILAVTTITCTITPAAHAENQGVYITQTNGVRVMRTGQSAAGYRMSFFHAGRDPVLVTYQEVYTNGWGPERFVEVHGGHQASVLVNTPTIVIVHTEAMANEQRGSSSGDHTSGYYPGH